MKHILLLLFGFIIAAIGTTVPAAFAVVGQTLSIPGFFVCVTLNVVGWWLFWTSLLYESRDRQPPTFRVVR